ncbi:S-layer homology domain-containing protein [Anaeropeptidivorans aminofermentans]|uniref:S-layer homology domain-containing protein n=1 Tax=Anaeropeptidivorans aminofermentans TaxID=2934315 RepID=UPI00202596A2|nr:S-layer homology domain-containing protein [Anaeropeptidivorans aminofermentans]
MEVFMEIQQMAERITSVSARKKAKRLLAASLAVLMINPVTGYGVAAQARESEIITAFVELPGEITAQQLEVGAAESGIRLPDTLDVTVRVAATDTADGNEEAAQSERSTTEEPAADENSSGDASVSGNESVEPENQDNSTADSLATGSEAELILDSGAEPVPGNSSADPSVETTTGSATITNLDDADTEQTEPEAFTSEERTLVGITWQINADNSTSQSFDSSENGAYYTYVPVLPEGYTLADGVSLPEINVLIGSAMMMRTLSGDSPISIGGTAVETDDWYALTDESGTVSTADANADNWNVHVTKDDTDTTVTVTLKDATIANNSYSTHAIDVSGYDLEIVLEGTSNRIGTGTTNDNGYAVYNRTDGKDITIGGAGDLTLMGYYGISINGTGNVAVEVDGSLTVQSQWQMISCGGQLDVTAKSITMNGYYINCGNGGVSLVAEDGDVNINGTGDYGIKVDSDILISVPEGAISISGEKYSLYTSAGTQISVYAKNDVSLTECVQGGDGIESQITLTSQTGDITVNSEDYQAIAGAKTYLGLSAPEGDITLTAESLGHNVIAGSSYELSILARGTLDVQGQDGITGFSTANIKAEKVNIAATGDGYGMSGEIVSVTNPEGGNCTDISISGGGGSRNALNTGDLTLKADRVIVAVASNASSAISAYGDVSIGDAGMIIGGTIASGTTTIADGVLQVQASGPDASSGLDLKTNTPVYSTYYKAGNGYALFTPAQDDTPAVLTLHNAEIENNDTPLQLVADTTIKLEGTNYLTNTNTTNGTVGIRASGTDGASHSVTFQGGNDDSLYVSAWQCTSGIEEMTISGGKVTVYGSCYGITDTGNVLLENGAQVSVTGGEDGDALSLGFLEDDEYESAARNLTISGGSSLAAYGYVMIPGNLIMSGESSSYTAEEERSVVLGDLTIGNGSTLTVQSGSEFNVRNSSSAVTNEGTLINNGILLLPYEYNAAKVAALNITGSGVVKLYSMGEFPEDDRYKVYVNGEFYADGGELNAQGSLNLIDPPEEATYYKSSADDAYIIYTPSSGSADAVVTLHGMNNTGYLQGGIVLPNAPVTIRVEGNNEIIWISVSEAVHITGSGHITGRIENASSSAELTIDSGVIANVMYSTTTGGVITNTVYGNYLTNDVYVTATDKLVLMPGTVLTVNAGYGELAFSEGASLSDMGIGTGASIVNNNYITLPKGTTAAQIAVLPLSGSGVVRVATAYDDGSPSAWDTYTNDGVAVKQIGDGGSGLDLTSGDHSGKTVANDGYAWNTDSKTLTLGNAYIAGNLTLPAGAIVNTTAAAIISERLEGESGVAMNITLGGTAPLTVGGGISGGANGDLVTVQGGAQVTVGGSVFLGASGGTDGTLTVTGAGTRLSVSSRYGYAVMCDTVNVGSGASMTANGDSIGVEALTGVNVTGGSTLTTNCEYGVYIIGGKLTVDDISKLITNATIAPFCIVDSTSNKSQSDVLGLAGVPSGTAVASVAGTQAKYWSLVATGGTLSVTDEGNTPVTLSGAKTGTLTFVKAATPGGNDDNEGGNNNNGGNDNGGSSSGGSSSDDSSSAVTTSEKKPDQPVIGSVNASGKVSDNHAVIIITDSMVKTAIEKAQADAKAQGKTANGIGAEVSLSVPGAKSFTIITERAALNRLVSTNVKLIQIAGLPVNISFDLASLKQQQAQGSGDITMMLKPVTFKNIRNAYDIALSTVKGGKTVNITSMGNGTAIISIPYTLGKGEAIGGLYAVSVDTKGNATRITGSTYDANSKSVIFTINHFSQYGIGYTAPAAKFTDIKAHWGKESIDYVVGRGLLSGPSETTFAPDTAMTRGMLVTALGRLANVDVKAYTTNSFTDVTLGSTCQPYIEWAYKKGIVQGAGNGKFEPDRAITREEIAVIFTNYAKATGYTLPVTRTAMTYADASSIGSAYKTAVTAMQQAGIMMGGTSNKFNPKASATRAEVSSMLSRYIKLTIDPTTAQGWAQGDAGQYVYYKDGKALTGTQTISGVKYFFNTDGILKTGWVKDGDNWRFYSGNIMLVGFWDLGANGDNKTYYFTKDGIMVAGKWLEIDGKWYYFYTDGSLAKSTKIDDYEVDANGMRKTK